MKSDNSISRVDLHPEELLERVRRGQAAPDEQQRVAAHLKECAVCRVESALFEQVTHDLKPQLDEEAFVAALRLKLQASGATRGMPRVGKRTGALVVAGIALAASAAAAAIAVHIGSNQPLTSLDAPPPLPRVEAPAPVERPPSVKTDEAADDDEPTDESGPAVTLPGEAEEIPDTPSQQGATKSPTLPTSQQLFSDANEARRAGNTKEAAKLYRTLQRRFPGSSEELVSRVVLGRLLMDRLGDSGGALHQFNSYLASPARGALREEAMVGRALALGRLGRPGEEHAAWSALLKSFPKSTYGTRARKRLAALGSPSEGSER